MPAGYSRGDFADPNSSRPGTYKGETTSNPHEVYLGAKEGGGQGGIGVGTLYAWNTGAREATHELTGMGQRTSSGIELLTSRELATGKFVFDARGGNTVVTAFDRPEGNYSQWREPGEQR